MANITVTAEPTTISLVLDDEACESWMEARTLNLGVDDDKWRWIWNFLRRIPNGSIGERWRMENLGFCDEEEEEMNWREWGANKALVEWWL